MKKIILLSAFILVCIYTSHAQNYIGTWKFVKVVVRKDLPKDSPGFDLANSMADLFNKSLKGQIIKLNKDYTCEVTFKDMSGKSKKAIGKYSVDNEISVIKFEGEEIPLESHLQIKLSGKKQMTFQSVSQGSFVYELSRK